MDRTGLARWMGLALISISAAACGSGTELGNEGRSGRDLGEKNLAGILSAHAQGKAARTPWAGSWWPYSKDGIANPGAQGKSPAAKYDAARGEGARAEAWEKANHGRGSAGLESWWGHCNGWAAASVFFPEPPARVKVNGEEFTRKDIKGLLTESSMEVLADFWGERVDAPAGPSSPEFRDVTPDQLLLVLAKYMGAQGRSVLIDRYTGTEVWNHALAGYRIHPPKPADDLGADPSAPNVHRILLSVTLWWVRDDVPATTQTPAFSFQDGATFSSRTLKMELWLDGPPEWADGQLRASGDVVGGVWRMPASAANAWPDYMWLPYQILESSGYANPEIDLPWILDRLMAG
jgi:hypothetical protein